MSPRLATVLATALGCHLMAALASALDWQAAEGYRRAALAIPPRGKTGFTDMRGGQTGIQFSNVLSEARALTNQIYLNGSGVAAGDVDGDGLCDLFFCGLDSPNVLYRNLGGWKFENITRAAGVACADQASTGAALADVDGDGDLDLLVNGIGRGTRLFLNDGQGRFREFTDEAGLRTKGGSMSLALADIDGDGLLDLYVVNYRVNTMRDLPDLRFRVSVTNGVYHLLSVNGEPASSSELAGRYAIENSSSVIENGEADLLFRNMGGGKFAPMGWTNGGFLDEKGVPSSIPYDWGLSAMFHDIDGDGAPDLYVCNDFQSPDRIWINDGHGQFRALARRALAHTSLFSMGVDFADIDRDGFDDFFVADMLSRDHGRRQTQVMDATAFAQARHPIADRPQVSRNTLFHNRGNGTYADLAQLSGLDASDWSWCPAFMDVDLDGYEDLLVTTGHGRDAQNADVAREIEEGKKKRALSPAEQLQLRRRFPRLNTPNAAFRNNGNLTFEDVSAGWGFDSRRISHGLALADLDNDGDLDLVVNCLNDAPLLYRNDSPKPRLAVRLRGRPPNTRGVGAKVRVLAPGMPPQSAEIHGGGRYLSSDDFIKVFAAGRETNRLAVEVTWRGGGHSRIANVPANSVIEVDEASSQILAVKTAPAAIPFFEDISQTLRHEHKDEPFDDFARQPLLPHKLSDLGPGVAWFDFNGDGWEDLLIGAGRGGRLAVFRNDGLGGFIPQRAKLLEAAAQKDTTTILGWRPNSSDVALLAGLANWEEAGTNALSMRQLSVVTGADQELTFPVKGGAGPLALADFDGDGALDLFIGGRAVAGRYPEAASSALLRNNKGQWRLDAESSRVFHEVGMVSSALFTDLNGDGWPDLVLACEWGAMRIFLNKSGQFKEWDAALSGSAAHSLGQLTGWWNSVGAGDFDGDGRLDLVAGNWGRNTSRQRFLQKPLRIYYDTAPEGSVTSLFEAGHDPGLNQLVPLRDWGAMSAVFPMLQGRFPNFTSFSTASVSDVLASDLPPMRELNARTFDSVLLLNRGDQFELRPLPMEAQLSPVFGVAVGDLDGDGNEDLFLAQNFFEVGGTESRHDAGVGVWLKGNGQGDFMAATQQESGISVYGEGRGAALCDFDHDGRLDLVVGQNQGQTLLYRNRQARPGVRVHLDGPEQNRQAAGAILRLVYAKGRQGPAHEIHLGSGYWSQDASDSVLGAAQAPEALEIRWPGGLAERVSLEAGAREISRSMPKK